VGMKNTYFLLRHGEAAHNASGLVSSSREEQGRTPSELTDIGRRDVMEIAKELETDKIDVIYSSPYKRTMETAAIIAKRLGLKINREKRIRETEMGVLDGVTMEKFREYFSGEEDRIEKAPEGGENLKDVRGRVGDFINEMEKTHDGENILVVSHGDALRIMESVIEGFEENEDILGIEYFEPGELRVIKPI
jgi:broad specificity phosphatase PhoE